MSWFEPGVVVTPHRGRHLNESEQSRALRRHPVRPVRWSARDPSSNPVVNRTRIPDRWAYRTAALPQVSERHDGDVSDVENSILESAASTYASAQRRVRLLAAMRLAIGLAVLAVPAPVLASWGYPEAERRSPTVTALLRVFGARDAVLGASTLAAAADPIRLKALASTAAAIDTGDTLVAAVLVATQTNGARRPALGWLAVGIPFSLLGWRAHQALSPPQ